MTTWINNTPPAISQDNLNAIENKITLLMNALYPVGAIYISTQQNNNTASTTGKMGCPIADFFGTWKRVQGSFLLAATPNGSSGASQAAGHTGGNATHTLAVNQLPSHNHDGLFWGSATGTAFVYTGYSGSNTVFDLADPGVNSRSINYSTTNHLVTGNTGSGAAINHMPPYLAVYMWERTS